MIHSIQNYRKEAELLAQRRQEIIDDFLKNHAPLLTEGMTKIAVLNWFDRLELPPYTIRDWLSDKIFKYSAPLDSESKKVILEGVLKYLNYLLNHGEDD